MEIGYYPGGNDRVGPSPRGKSRRGGGAPRGKRRGGRLRPENNTLNNKNPDLQLRGGGGYPIRHRPYGPAIYSHNMQSYIVLRNWSI